MKLLDAKHQLNWWTKDMDVTLHSYERHRALYFTMRAAWSIPPVALTVLLTGAGNFRRLR